MRPLFIEELEKVRGGSGSLVGRFTPKEPTYPNIPTTMAIGEESPYGPW